MTWPVHRSFSEGGPRPAFMTTTESRGEAGQQGIRYLQRDECRDARQTATAGQPLQKDLLQLGAELLPEARGIRKERRAVQCAGKAMAVHRLDSGSNRWARAASTWSASRIASALAVARPYAVIR